MQQLKSASQDTLSLLLAGIADISRLKRQPNVKRSSVPKKPKTKLVVFAMFSGVLEGIQRVLHAAQ